MILTPTLEDIINSFIDNIRSTIPEASTTPVSVIREALINPSASQIAFLFDLSKRIATIQDIFSATGTDLDILAKTYKITRRGGTTATGTLYLNLMKLNSRDTITVNDGSPVRVPGGSIRSVSFTIVGDYTFSSTDRATFEANAASVRSQLDSIGWTTVNMVVAVPIRATSIGTTGNIGSYTLTSAGIADIPSVVNLSATSGGTAVESDESLRSRIIAVYTGNSVGTEAGLLAAASTPSTVTGAFIVKSGDPLMTRDGAVYDENQNLITVGHGRAVDIYVQGTSLSSNTETAIFELNDTEHFLSIDNGILIGQPVGDNFGFLPTTSITSIVGEESSAAFSQGALVTDEDGNIIVEGNIALIKDVEADQYSIVENLITRERKLAKYINPSSTKYTVIETLSPSDYANSPFSQDKILFLKNAVDVTNESINRGKFNGADQLRFSNVTSINQVYEDLTITETIKIEDYIEVPGGIAITLKHTPIVEINSVFHSRLGVEISFEVQDSELGTVKLVGRTPPRQGDIVVIEYVWRKIYQQDLNYNLTGDLIDWIAFADENGRTSSELLPEEKLQSSNIISVQPNVASHLQLTMSGLSTREVVETKVSGTVAEITNQKTVLKASDPFTFAVTGLDNIGRIFKVTNVTKSFDYNLTGYILNSNKMDPTARVDTSLLSQQFRLSEQANIDLVEVGDKIVLGKPARTVAWSSQSDFENNVDINLAPVYDPTKIDFTSGGLILKTPLLDESIAVTSLGGTITQNTTLSGIIEITENLIIREGVVVDIEPETIIKIRPSDQLVSQIAFAQRIVFDPDLLQSDATGVDNGYSYLPPISTNFDEYLFLYFKPDDFPSNFFTIINDLGQTLSIRFEQDILTKIINGSTIIFYVNGRQVDNSFNYEIEQTIDLLETSTSIKATLLGARSGQDGIAKFTAAKITSLNKYYIILERIPVTSTSIQNDFSLAVEADNSITFERFSYNSAINVLQVDGDIVSIDGYGDTTSATTYILTHFTEEISRLSIVVEGTLRVLGATEQTSILFTSGADTASPGDWEGIIFNSKSHTNNARTLFQSNLDYARIMYANTGVSVRSSDVNIQNCVIRDCLNSGITVSSNNQYINQYSTSDFNLIEINDPFVKFESVTRLGYSLSDGIKLARYSLPDNLVTATGEIPPIKQKLTSTSYIVDLNEGTDYLVYIEGQRATSIDTTLPTDGYSDYSLEPNKDYMIEYDINTGYSLVFLYTSSSTKLRNVYYLIIDLENTNREGSISINYYRSISNGIIYNNLIFNSDVGVLLNSLATTSINKNTIDNIRLGIVSSDSIVSITNNLITGFTTTAISSDPNSLLIAQRNDMFSQTILDQDQTGIFDTDILLRTVSTSNTTFVTRTPSKYKVGMIVQIDDEQMLVQGVTDDSVVMARAQNQTTYATHQSGSELTLYQLNQIFSVTGIDGNYCELIETDVNGKQNLNSIAIQMRLVSPYTFRASFPINRRADFYYKFRYGNRGSSIVNETQVKVFPRNQMGIGTNDIITIFHEIPLTSVLYTPNNQNYSADPLYNNRLSSDYSYLALTSPASRQNPIYGSLISPNPLHRYVGYIDVVLLRNLGVGDTRISVPYDPLIVTSFDEIRIVGNDTLTQGILLTINSFTYNITGAEADQGAIGVFVLDSNIHPTGVTVSGQYRVEYVQPVDLGSSISPYYLESEISYVIDVGSEVLFDRIAFNKDDLGGEIEFSFQVASSISDIQSSAVSLISTTSPIIIDQVATTNIGSVIQINVKLKGNDSSFNSSLAYQFPILQDFSLSYLPSKDTQEYKVLSLIKNTVQNETNILIDQPILTSTFSSVGSEDTLELYVRKKANNFDPDQEFIITTTQGVVVGDTFIVAKGDLVTIHPDADSSDIIKIDYLSYFDENETIYFAADGSEITENMYSNISSIESIIKKDKVTVTSTTEKITINSLSQPESGNTYRTSYQFEAPLDGESLTISYAYNTVPREASFEVEPKKSIYSDVLVKQVTEIPVQVALILDVESGESPLSVQTQVSTAIVDLFETTLGDIQTERRLDESDIIRATGDITGIESIKVTTLSRNAISGEIQSPLIFVKRESPILEELSPRITTTQNGKIVSLRIE